MPPLNHCDPCAVISLPLCQNQLAFPFLMDVQDQGAYISVIVTNNNGNQLTITGYLQGGYFTIPLDNQTWIEQGAGWYNENQTWNVVFLDGELNPINFTYQGNTYSCAWVSFIDSTLLEY